MLACCSIAMWEKKILIILASQTGGTSNRVFRSVVLRPKHVYVDANFYRYIQTNSPTEDTLFSNFIPNRTRSKHRQRQRVSCFHLLHCFMPHSSQSTAHPPTQNEKSRTKRQEQQSKAKSKRKVKRRRRQQQQRTTASSSSS